MYEDIPLIVLQINDALFPIGGYTQSFGLETYIQQGLVCDRTTAGDYVRQNLRYNLKYTELLALRLAFESAQAEAIEEIMRLEQTVTAGKAPKEIRLASHKLGSRFVKTVYAMGAVSEQSVFDQYCKRQPPPVNHCIAYGVFCAAAGVEEKTAMTAYLYAALAAAVTVCVKSVPLSQTDGQRIIYESHALLEQIVTETLLLTEADLCLSTPGFDIRCMQHEQLYSRLYMS